MGAKKKKAKGRGPSLLAKRVGELVVEKMMKGEKIVMKELMLQAGAAESYATHPEMITSQAGFLDVLRANGITDLTTAKTHTDLMKASRIEKFYFDDWSYRTKGKGKKVKSRGTPISDEKIREVIESVSGCKVLNINRLRSQIGTIEVIYSAPENLTRKAALELAYKVQGNIKPDTQLHAHAHLHSHEYTLPPERKAVIDAIIKENQ